MSRPALSSTTLAPYGGAFAEREAWHLLRRTTFVTTPQRVSEVVDLGLEATLTRLLATRTTVPVPVNNYFEDDPHVPVGESWVEAPLVEGVNVNMYRSRSLQAWLAETYHDGGLDLSARMSLFWLNHFAVARIIDARAFYAYLRRIRAEALGNFRDLVRGVATEPAMLRFLNGNVSTAESPNENFARELLELYTVGKGQQVAPEDYTTYTETDVREIARALTGWRIENVSSTVAGELPQSVFNPRHHDETPRQLSGRFGDRRLEVAGAGAVDEVLDAVFAHSRAPHYLCRKLYRFFVYYDVDDAVEANVIAPMAETLRASDYDVAPVLRQLLGSEHFFAAAQGGALVKSPLDYVFDLTGGLGYPIPDDLRQRENYYRHLFIEAREQNMELDAPPSVAGFRPWHQAPAYNRGWVNASTLGRRTTFAGQVLGNGFAREGFRQTNDLLRLIEGFANPYDPNDLVDEFAARLLTDPLTAEQRAALKEVLIPGLPDFEWTVEYTDFRDDPDDAQRRKAVERKVRSLALAIATTAEAHLF